MEFVTKNSHMFVLVILQRIAALKFTLYRLDHQQRLHTYWPCDDYSVIPRERERGRVS